LVAQEYPLFLSYYVVLNSKLAPYSNISARFYFSARAIDN